MVAYQPDRANSRPHTIDPCRDAQAAERSLRPKIKPLNVSAEAMLNSTLMRAIIIAAVTSAEGSAQVIARAPDLILFGRCHPEATTAKVYWFRAMLKDGTTRAVSSSSIRTGHDDPPEVPASVADLLTGEAPAFVAPGDVFEIETIDLEDRRSTVRMSQADFNTLMRSLLA